MDATVLEAAQWAFIVIGALLLLAPVVLAVWRAYKPDAVTPTSHLFMLLAGGVLCIGLGGYGPDFFDPYTRLIATVLRDPSQQTYERVFQAVGDNQLSQEESNAVLTLFEANPVLGADSVLTKAIASAQDGPGKRALEQTYNRVLPQYEQAKALGDRILMDPSTGSDAIAGLFPEIDPGVRTLVAQTVLDDLRRRGLLQEGETTLRSGVDIQWQEQLPQLQEWARPGGAVVPRQPHIPPGSSEPW